MFETLAPYIIAGLVFALGYTWTRWFANLAELRHWKAITESLADNIEAMQEEGCAAMGALENIFNGVTAGGMPHSKLVKKIADVATQALALVPVCGHKAGAEAEADIADRLNEELTVAKLNAENWQNLAVESEARAEEAERLLGLVNDRLVAERE